MTSNTKFKHKATKGCVSLYRNDSNLSSLLIKRPTSLDVFKMAYPLPHHKQIFTILKIFSNLKTLSYFECARLENSYKIAIRLKKAMHRCSKTFASIFPHYRLPKNFLDGKALRSLHTNLEALPISVPPTLNKLHIYFENKHVHKLNCFHRIKNLEHLTIKCHLQELFACQSETTRVFKKSLASIKRLELCIMGCSKKKFPADSIDTSSIFWIKITKLNLIMSIQNFSTLALSGDTFRNLKALQFTSISSKDSSANESDLSFIKNFWALHHLKLSLNINPEKLVETINSLKLPNYLETLDIKVFPSSEYKKIANHSPAREYQNDPPFSGFSCIEKFKELRLDFEGIPNKYSKSIQGTVESMLNASNPALVALELNITSLSKENSKKIFEQIFIKFSNLSYLELTASNIILDLNSEPNFQNLSHLKTWGVLFDSKFYEKLLVSPLREIEINFDFSGEINWVKQVVDLLGSISLFNSLKKLVFKIQAFVEATGAENWMEDMFIVPENLKSSLENLFTSLKHIEKVCLLLPYDLQDILHAYREENNILIYQEDTF